MIETVIHLALFHPVAITVGLLLGICMHQLGAGLYDGDEIIRWIASVLLQLSGVPVAIFFLIRFVKWVWLLG